MNEKLSNLIDDIYDDIEHGNMHGAEAILVKLQLDAFKAGAEWAAKISENSEACCSEGLKISASILSASSNLKEIPK